MRKEGRKIDNFCFAESFLEDGEIDPEEERRLIDGFDNNSKDGTILIQWFILLEKLCSTQIFKI